MILLAEMDEEVPTPFGPLPPFPPQTSASTYPQCGRGAGALSEALPPVIDTRLMGSERKIGGETD